MLIRTRRYKCYRIATVIRVLLVLGIPLVYLMFGNTRSEEEMLKSTFNSGNLLDRVLVNFVLISVL